ncbi:DUF6525 family protein [Pacificibacter sp. 1_MG-2023]|nr:MULTISPECIES: DUF6525 family protein [Pacificibacter]MDO6614955.1 DUF6525 family protein [Pacificibacter sp. 1_MG-2023]
MERSRRRRNAQSSLKRRVRKGDSMAAYDQLPTELRSWLMHAALPWSPRSVLRSWKKSLQTYNGDIEEAKQHLSRVERQLLKQDKFHPRIDEA